MAKRIVVVTHPCDRFDEQYYFQQIARLWERAGHEVLVRQSSDNRVDADLAVLHCDLTRAPQDLLDLVSSYPKTVNARVADVSKRVISREIVASPMDYDGPVIVKSNLNSAGWREKTIAAMEAGRRGFKVTTEPYRIYECAFDVPEEVWRDEERVVEKYLPEMRDGCYCLRNWIFLGKQETNRLCFSHSPVVKSRNIFLREDVPEVPADLRRRREELGFQYGKFDYALVNGRAVLYDVNRTPMFSGNSLNPFQQRTVLTLAKGLDDLFAEDS